MSDLAIFSICGTVLGIGFFALMGFSIYLNHKAEMAQFEE